MRVAASSRAESVQVDLHAPVVLSSVDSHISPRLVEDLRDHCPPEHLDAFDEFAQQA